MFDLFSDDVRRNPFPVYERLRAASPVLREPRSGLWVILDYDGVKRALGDQEAFSSDHAATAKHPVPPWLVFMDPPRHTKLRALISRAFTPRVVAGIEPQIRELSRELLAATMARAEVNGGVMDLAADYAIPLPMMVIARMIGIPPHDRARFRRWSDAILRLSYTVRGISSPVESAAAAVEWRAAHEEIKAYLPELIERRQVDPADDLLTGLALAEVDGQRLTREELVGFFELLLVGGQETTANLICNAIVSLLDFPDQLALLRERTADLLPSAIEESLRYRSPFQWTFRSTRRDVPMHGQTIPGGTLLLACMGSANRDPKQFEEPNRFDITRHPNPHLAFGYGAHFCLGAPLSRMEAKIALADLLAAMPPFGHASEKPWEPRKALHVHGPTRLLIRFEHG
jgi:cytochrome P450